jgi:hypothetical protein
MFWRDTWGIWIVVLIAFAGVGSLIYTEQRPVEPQRIQDTEFGKVAEWAYMRGQIAARQGDLRVEYRENDFFWTKSPWEDGAPPRHESLREYTR